MSTVKRLFLYTIAFINLVVFSIGTGSLLSLGFDILFGDDGWQRYFQYQLSIGIAMLIIGGSLWFLFWKIIGKGTAGDVTEAGAGLRKFYLNLVLVISALTGISNLAGFFGWTIGGSPYNNFPSLSLATIIVTACLWFYHSRIEDNEGQPSGVAKLLRRWYVYILSAFGLITITVNIILAINSSVLYLLPVGEISIQRGLWHGLLADQISWIVIGGLTWWYFWFRLAKGDYQSTLRQIYLYLLTIAGGAVAALSALAAMVYNFFSLMFGNPGDFAFLGWTIPTVLVCGGVWMFHRKLGEEEAAHLPLNTHSPRRLYLYLMSFIGMGTGLFGIVYLFSVVLGFLFSSISEYAVSSGNWWSNQLSLALSLLLVGIPLWLYCWRKILRMTDEGGIVERIARSRRIFLYSVLGISIIAALGALVMVVYQLINGVLQGDFERGFFRNIVWGLSILFTAVPVLIYHWRLLREDQQLGTEKAIRRKRVNIIAGEETGEMVTRIEARLGYQVKKLRHTGENSKQLSMLSDEEIGKIVEAISESEGVGVIVDLTGAIVKLLPYKDE